MRKMSLNNHHLYDPLRTLWRRLMSLRSLVTFMQSGAHPDDETSKLLARLSLGDGMHIVYANAVRGQGGQNALGTERGDDLGLIRTQELIRAMVVLGADLCWLAETENDTIRDFGFSKSPDQTFSIWGQEHILRQMIKAIRLFKPDVLCPTFLDVPGQHGHHRAITRTTNSAFEMSGNPDVFTDLRLQPWTVSKLYLPAWGGAGNTYDDVEPPPEATTFVDVGEFDYRMGGTYVQIGEWSHGYHATQGMGELRDESPETLPLHLLKTSALIGSSDEVKITSGLSASWTEFEKVFSNPQIRKMIRLADKTSLKALQSFPDNNSVADSLAEFSDAVVSLKELLPESQRHRAELKIRQAGQAAAACCSLNPRLRFFPSEPLAGQEFDVELSIFEGSGLDKKNIMAALAMPEGLSVVLSPEPTLEGSRLFWKGKGQCGKGMDPLSSFRSFHSEVMQEDPPRADVSFFLSGRDYKLSVTPDSPFTTFPEISCSLHPEKFLIPLNRESADKIDAVNMGISITVHSPAEHDVDIDVPKGFSTDVSSFHINSNSDSLEEYEFNLKTSAGLCPGTYSISAALNGGPAWNYQEFEYPHVGRTIRHYKCSSRFLVVEVQTSQNLKVGWIDGGFDRSWHWASEMGFSVSMISDEELLKGRFDQYDTIVVGVMACSVRPVNTAQKSLRRWVSDGGRLVTQYHRPIDRWDPDSTPPGRLVIGRPSIRWRITDPSAPIEVLNSKHDLMNAPNDINENDWEGWVKERGLYFSAEWDDRYEAMISVSDPGEPALLGGLLYGKFDQGSHVHCALNLFHQMDHLVPGAFRIFANLLSS